MRGFKIIFLFGFNFRFKKGNAPNPLLGKNFKEFKDLLKKWTLANVEKFDIWDIELVMNDVKYTNIYFNNYKKKKNGDIRKINKTA